MSLSDKIDANHQLLTIEDEIANSRKYYNAVVRNLNTKVEMFPSNIIAKMFNFKLQKMFEANEDERTFFNDLFSLKDEVTRSDLYDKFYLTLKRISRNINRKENQEKI